MMTPINLKSMFLITCLVMAACVPTAVQTEPPQVDENIYTPTPSEITLGTETPGINERRPSQTLPAGLERLETPQAEPITGEVPPAILDEILADLESRTGTSREAIQVIRAESVVWDDGSLGCPKPGEFYIQILIKGYWVVLEVEGKQYDYRLSDTGNFFLCEGGDNSIYLIPVMPIAPHGKTPRGRWVQVP